MLLLQVVMWIVNLGILCMCVVHCFVIVLDLHFVTKGGNPRAQFALSIAMTEDPF